MVFGKVFLISTDFCLSRQSYTISRSPSHQARYETECTWIGGVLSRWIQKCVADRVQRVVINEQHSEWSPVRSGVPRGSVSAGFCM